MRVKFLMWFTPSRIKILSTIIPMVGLILSYLIMEPSSFDLMLITKAYCVSSSDMVLTGTVQPPVEVCMPLNDQLEEMSNNSVVYSQENLNTEPSIPRVFSGCSNRMAARWMGGITGFFLGLATSIWLYVNSGIDFSPYACDLFNAMNSASDSSIRKN